MLFKNLDVGKTVCIDWDLFFDDFILTAIPYTKRLIREVGTITGQEIAASYQQSANNNVHLKLCFVNSVTVLDAFMIRAYMGDDETRLRLDMARYLKTGSLHEMNRCFQDKILIKGRQATLVSAGPWIPFDHDEIPDITTQESHALISKMQKECIWRKREAKKVFV